MQSQAGVHATSLFQNGTGQQHSKLVMQKASCNPAQLMQTGAEALQVDKVASPIVSLAPWM
jgi:hypothetical protein